MSGEPLVGQLRLMNENASSEHHADKHSDKHSKER